MAEELEKTCENCKYDYEDMEGAHCRHCIHSAEERFEPKEKETSETEIRNKAIDEFAERLKSDEFQKYDLDMVFETSRDLSYSNCVNSFCEYIDEIAEQMKGGE
jgi:hypothetical protein